MHALASGQARSHYCVISPLGAGGMGEVYLAEETASSANELAILSSWLGDYDQTLHWLRKECEERGL